MTSRDLKAINRAIDAVYWHETGASFASIAKKLGVSRKYARDLALEGAADPKIRAAVEQRKKYRREQIEEAMTIEETNGTSN